MTQQHSDTVEELAQELFQPKNGSWSSSNRPNLVTRRQLDPSVIGDRRVKIATAPQLQYQHIRYVLSICYNEC